MLAMAVAMAVAISHLHESVTIQNHHVDIRHRACMKGQVVASVRQDNVVAPRHAYRRHIGGNHGVSSISKRRWRQLPVVHCSPVGKRRDGIPRVRTLPP